MSAAYVELGWLDVAAASTLVLACAGASVVLELGLARRVVIAAMRMTVQLAAVGLALRALFATASPAWTATAALAMVVFAGHEIRARQRRPLAGAWGPAISTVTMMLAGVAVTMLALTTQIRPTPWYDPRYAIPILGMILGNTLTGVSLGLNRLTEGAWERRAVIEARLALGETARGALRPIVRSALHDGMIPIVNAMSAAGLVFLPGMMTGQILAGAAPEQAIKYQIVVMFLIAGATSLGVLVAVLAGAWRLTDERERLRLDRLRPLAR
jgi:putative ABC transport system permease protein